MTEPVFHVEGLDESKKVAIAKTLALALGPRAGHWRITFDGNQFSEYWRMTVEGPGEHYETQLDGAEGEHDPGPIAAILNQLRSGDR
jgi:hypothetical protein